MIIAYFGQTVLVYMVLQWKHQMDLFPIVAIFYSVFHPIEGTKIVHQFPENSISTGRSPTSIGDGGLFDFDTIIMLYRNLNYVTGLFH